MVTSDVHSLDIQKWAETAAPFNVAEPSTVGLTQSEGYTISYKLPSGNNPEMEVIQWLWRAWSGMLVELNAHGLLVWNAGLPYVHPALVFGSDSLPYISVRDSTGVDPTTDTNDSDWTLLVAVIANTFDASAIVSGVINVSHIPNLNANKINAGTLGTGRIPSLPASRITSGQFSTARIPGLSASQTTSGTFAVARIPNLNASKINSGTLDADRLPQLVITTDPTQTQINNLPDGGSILVRDTTAYSP